MGIFGFNSRSSSWSLVVADELGESSAFGTMDSFDNLKCGTLRVGGAAVKEVEAEDDDSRFRCNMVAVDDAVVVSIFVSSFW
jgi:hypothetical protein